MNKIIHGPNVAGQSIADRVMAAKHTITGQDLAKAVLKATTDEVMGPKRKHLDYLIWCTKVGHVSIPEFVKLLLERTHNTSWVVVLKALLTTHDVINYGNEQFCKYLSSSHSVFNLGSFTDRTDRIGSEMSLYVRCYAKYLNQKLSAYKLMGYDFCKVKRGKDDGYLRMMETEKLLKALPVLQTQLDTLLEFDMSPDELTNGVISYCFLAMFQDMIRLFACYNDGIINLLEKFFDMSEQHCKEALQIYKKFIATMDRVRMFFRVAQMVGVNKSDIPNLAEVPDGLYEALEDHMKSFGSPGRSDRSAVSSTARPSAGITSAISKFSAAAQLGAAPGAGSGALSISEDERRRILQEEQRQLDILKKQKQSGRSTVTSSPTASANPQPQIPTPPLSALSTARRVSMPSRTQSVPAPDTSGWTRVEDDAGTNAVPVRNPPGFTGFGDMLTPTKSPTAIETERRTQSELLARSMSLQSNWSPQPATSTMSAVTASQITSPPVMSGMTPTYVVPTLQLYSPTPLPYTGPHWGQPGVVMMPAAPMQATATSAPMMRPAGLIQQTPYYPSGAV